MTLNHTPVRLSSSDNDIGSQRNGLARFSLVPSGHGTPERRRPMAAYSAISEFPKGRKYLISLSFRGKSSVRQVGGSDGTSSRPQSGRRSSTSRLAPRPGSHLVAHGRAPWKLTAPWTHRTRPPRLGKRCAFSTSCHSVPTKNPKRPENIVGKPGSRLFHGSTTRVLHRNAGMASKAVAEKYAVSRAWVDRLKQRRREKGEIAPRQQTRWRTPMLQAQLSRLAGLIREQPDLVGGVEQALRRRPVSRRGGPSPSSGSISKKRSRG